MILFIPVIRMITLNIIFKHSLFFHHYFLNASETFNLECFKSIFLVPKLLYKYLCPSACPSVFPSVCPSVRPYVHLSVRPYVRMSVHPYVCLSDRQVYGETWLSRPLIKMEVWFLRASLLVDVVVILVKFLFIYRI